MRVISKLYALCQISVLLSIGVQARPSKDSNFFKSLFNHELSERDANDESKAFQEWVTREHGSNNEDSDHVVNVDDGGASLSDNPPGNIVITNDDKKNDDYDYEGKVDGDYEDDDQGGDDNDDQGEDDGDYEDDQGEDGDYEDENQGEADGDYEDDDQVNKDGPHPFNFEDNPDISASDIIYQVNSNAGLMHNTFEEDILIDPSRVQEVASWGAENDITKRMPTSVNNREYRWPGGLVPYKIDSTFLRDHKSNTQQLEAAKAEYASKTCIKLEELPPGRQSYHVNLISDSGCYSYIGRLSGISGFSQSQDISIGIGCNFKSTIVHEFLHALGFWHEQSRPDRDDYVTILWQNIRRGVENNFQKHGSEKTTNLGVEYDYESVMHYGKTAFSVNGQPTIIRKNDPEGQLGQLVYGGLSAKDAEEINIFYGCKTPGTTAPPPTTPSTSPPTTPSTTPPTTPSTSPPTTPSTSPPPTIEIESDLAVP
ncbi:low choriolytic enzyme-like [Dendronephthya gigantea]|uniref:low choriolytic enzyme-like n=1 Tax=Dendronephthya gigantea TaxID=151771 RepID=UPI00106C396E|nr:low choriolytic enzyme-like [Dendronephthya gigantea]